MSTTTSGILIRYFRPANMSVCMCVCVVNVCVCVCISGLTFSKLQKYDIGIIWALVVVFCYTGYIEQGQSGRRDSFCAKTCSSSPK